jgi:ComF family protein
MRGLSSKPRWIADPPPFRVFYRYFLDLLFPPRCVQCHSFGRSICGKCRAQIDWIDGPVCRICGQPLGRIKHHSCVDPDIIEWIRSAAVFSGPMRRAVHSLKYSRDRTLAFDLVEMSFEHLDPALRTFDRIVPVPLGRIRERNRGYNQSVLLAEALSLKTQIPIDTRCLVRSRETRSQVGLSHDERIQNVGQAFTASSVTDGKVLLVDDVCTTGATLQSCAESLRAAGARSVAGVTLARAMVPGLDQQSHPVGGKK